MRIPNITVPSDIAGVIRLLKARQWERAAIVYAYTKPDNGGRPSNTRNLRDIQQVNLDDIRFPCSIAQFARLGVAGLQDRNTVAMYRERWAEAIRKRKAKVVKPGDHITVPDLPWEPTGHDDYDTEHEEEFASEAQRLGVSKGAAKRAAANKAALEAAIAADPEAARAALRGLQRQQDKEVTVQPESRLTKKQRALKDKEWEAKREDLGHSIDLAFADHLVIGIVGTLEELAEDMRKLVESYAAEGIPDETLDKIDEANAVWLEELAVAQMARRD